MCTRAQSATWFLSRGRGYFEVSSLSTAIQVRRARRLGSTAGGTPAATTPLFTGSFVARFVKWGSSGASPSRIWIQGWLSLRRSSIDERELEFCINNEPAAGENLYRWRV